MGATYRRTRQGEWVVQGPTSMVTPGATVTVTRRSGEERTETIDRVGRSLDRNGTEMVYGYIAQTGNLSYQPGAGLVCEECGDTVRRGTVCWETGLRH